MPKREDIKRIVVLGSGPIVIGQACEFDYSGTQAIKALKEEGYEVVLLNSNPATIMTDPELADRTYIKPLLPQYLDRILEREKPDAVLPTVGGQTALNLAIEADRQGIFARHGVEIIGAPINVIERAEDREQFKAAMLEIGLDVPRSAYVRSVDEAWDALKDIGFPVIIRPSFTMGGSGAAIAYNRDPLGRQLIYQKIRIDLGLDCVIGIHPKEVAIPALGQALFRGGGCNDNDRHRLIEFHGR